MSKVGRSLIVGRILCLPAPSGIGRLALTTSEGMVIFQFGKIIRIEADDKVVAAQSSHPMD
jgi:hypothetical protein